MYVFKFVDSKNMKFIQELWGVRLNNRYSLANLINK